MSYRCTVNLAP